jgi:Zn-dependent protease with chaperone function
LTSAPTFSDNAVNPRQFVGSFFDGRTPRKHRLNLRLSPQGIALVFPEGQTALWSYASIRLLPTENVRQPVRLEHDVRTDAGTVTEILAVEDVAFLAALHEAAPGALIPEWRLPRHSTKRRLALILILIAIPFVVYGLWFYSLPVLTERMAQKVPATWERTLGDAVFFSLNKKIMNDPANPLRNAIDRITRRLLAAAPDSPYEFRVYIESSEIFNAYALPGGIILITERLLAETASPEELAGVMAHEFQHVLQRHPTRGIIRTLASSMILALLVGDANSIMDKTLNLVGSLERLRFSREMEAEADRLGMEMILAAKIDPKGTISMFEKLEAEENKMLGFSGNSARKETETAVSEWLEYLSSHPSGKNRVAEMIRQARRQSFQPVPLLENADWKKLIAENIRKNNR